MGFLIVIREFKVMHEPLKIEVLGPTVAAGEAGTDRRKCRKYIWIKPVVLCLSMLRGGFPQTGLGQTSWRHQPAVYCRVFTLTPTRNSLHRLKCTVNIRDKQIHDHDNTGSRLLWTV